jgi:uncharacterized protein (TIRG00374 family)
VEVLHTNSIERKFNLKEYVIKLIIGCAILGVTIWFVGPGFLKIITTVNFFFLSMSLIIHVLASFVTAYRLKFFLKESGENISASEIFPIHLSGMILSDISPGKIGYLYTAQLMKVHHNISRSKTLSSIFSGQMCDLSIRAIAGIIGLIILILLVLNISLGLFLYFLLGIVFLILLSVFLYILGEGRMPLFIEKIISKSNKLYQTYLKFQTHTTKKSAKVFLYAYFITLIGWGLTILRLILVAGSIGVALPLYTYIFLFPLVSASAFIPITVAGLGIVEGGYVLLFWIFKLPLEQAIAFSILDRTVTIIIDSIGLHKIK